MIRALGLDDEQLLANLKKGGAYEERAIRQLLKTEGGKVRSFILNHGGTAEEADEVFYDALTALVFNVRQGKFNEASSVGTYLFAIAKRMWYKQFERKMNQQNNLEQYKDWNDESVVFEDLHLVQESTRALVHQVLGRLHDKCREVLLLWAQHFNMEEIAATLGFKNAQVAMNKKSKCLKQLTLLLEAEPEVRQTLAELRFK